MIDEIACLVENACAQDTNIYGYGIWTHHVVHVVQSGLRLAPLFGADPEIVEVAALLHDYASIKDETLAAEHHLHGAAEAERILRNYNYPPERTRAVQEAIRAHRSSVPQARTSPEAECLANADALTHIEQVPSLLHAAYTQLGMGIDEGAAWVRSKLERDWQKLSPPVREMARARYEAALAVLATED